MEQTNYFLVFSGIDNVFNNVCKMRRIDIHEFETLKEWIPCIKKLRESYTSFFEDVDVDRDGLCYYGYISYIIREYESYYGVLDNEEREWADSLSNYDLNAFTEFNQFISKMCDEEILSINDIFVCNIEDCSVIKLL